MTNFPGLSVGFLSPSEARTARRIRIARTLAFVAASNRALTFYEAGQLFDEHEDFLSTHPMHDASLHEGPDKAADVNMTYCAHCNALTLLYRARRALPPEYKPPAPVAQNPAKKAKRQQVAGDIGADAETHDPLKVVARGQLFDELEGFLAGHPALVDLKSARARIDADIT